MRQTVTNRYGKVVEGIGVKKTKGPAISSKGNPIRILDGMFKGLFRKR